MSLTPIFPIKSEQGQKRLLSCSNMIVILEHLINEQLALMKDVQLKHKMKQVLNGQFAQTSRLIKDIEKELEDKAKQQKIAFGDVMESVAVFYSYCFQELNKIDDPEKMIEVIALLKEFNESPIKG